MNDRCTICHGTGFYINSRGVKSEQACNICEPEKFAMEVAKRKARRNV